MTLALVIAIALAAAPAATYSADLDGGGAIETITATARGKTVRLEVSSAHGDRLARTETPAPAAGAARLSITAGSVGSSGQLIEVAGASSDGAEECHTLWRYRDGNLTPVPVVGRNGPLPGCAAPQGWAYHWKAWQPNAPDDYVRERTRSVADGSHHQTEVFRYTGFQADLDPAHSTAELNGVYIPSWPAATLYPRPALDRLALRFDLSELRTSPRLRFDARPEQGVFAVFLERPNGVERYLVTAGGRRKTTGIIHLTLRSASGGGDAEIRLSADESLPIEARLIGMGDDARAPFAVVTNQNGSATQAYRSAEEELALLALSGTWDARDGERVEVTVVNSFPTVVRFAGSDFALHIDNAPPGTDVVLIPAGATDPSLALTLRGPDAFARAAISCPPAQPCRAEGTGKLFRRLGSSIATH